MNVLLINGSPHEKGCTYTALAEIAAELEKNGVEAEILHVGKGPVGGCVACGGCAGKGKCVFDDAVNMAIEKAKTADGFIFGSPVHYASASGSITGFLDRAFYSGSDAFRGKPGAAVVSARRAGTTAAFDQLNKYFGICQMPVVSANYWNMVHGATAQDVEQDLEGLQTMRVLARNMAWLLRCIEAGRVAGVQPPRQEEKQKTNFIR